MSEENNYNEEIVQNETCPAMGYQAVSVSVPVTVSPFAKTGRTVTKCLSTPIVKSGKDDSIGVKNGTCNFTISQNIVVAIPVAFGAEATVGDTYVDCMGTSNEEIDNEHFENIRKQREIEGEVPESVM